MYVIVIHVYCVCIYIYMILYMISYYDDLIKNSERFVFSAGWSGVGFGRGGRVDVKKLKSILE